MRGAKHEHAAEEARARRPSGGQRHSLVAGAGGSVSRPDEGFPQGRQRARARARAEAPPRSETTAARDREAHRQARAAGEIASTCRTASLRAGRPRFTPCEVYLPPNRTPAVSGMNGVFAASNDFATSTYRASKNSAAPPTA